VAIDVAFISRVDSPRFCEKLFAVLPDVMFCLKDTERRYRALNVAFVERIGLKDTRRLIGRLAEEFFPPLLAETYREQDEHVLGTGAEIVDQLELSLNRDGSQGWYLATKVPLHDRSGKIIGLASVSRDLRASEGGGAYPRSSGRAAARGGAGGHRRAVPDAVGAADAPGLPAQHHAIREKEPDRECGAAAA
jgi:PAS domain S-box-containing protein